MTNVILELPTIEASVSNNILNSISKQSVHVYCTKLTNIMNNSLKDKKFLDKKDNKVNKENYGPVSIISKFSEVFERSVHHQLSSYMELKLSKFVKDFRKNHQYALLRKMENWKT